VNKGDLEETWIDEQSLWVATLVTLAVGIILACAAAAVLAACGVGVAR
jgi:hypothetical protein